MKFDFAIGNPPYQEEIDGDNNYAPPVYNKFMDAAYEIASKVELIHPARFLFNAGSTPKAWNEKMLNDIHFKVLEYQEDCTKIFSNTEIKGGVVITYHDEDRDYGVIETYTPYEVLNNILQKVIKSGYESIINIIFIQNKFNLEALYEDHEEYREIIGSDGKDRRFRNNIFEKIDTFTTTRSSETDIPVIGVVKNKREWRYLPVKYFDLEHENLCKWKVLVVRVNGNGVFGEVLSTPFISKPQEGYTQTFIGVGAFETEEEASNLLKYIKGKFSRTMLGVLKITQDNNRETWKYVPLQDFTASSDIDWSKSISEIDQQLYSKYGLSEEEIEFIETHVKPME